MKTIDKLAWVEIKNKRILSTRTKGKDTYYIPGGKREENESDAQALIREIREELSVELLPDTLKLFGVFEAQAHGKSEGILVRMTCYTGLYEGTIIPDSEIDEVVWFSHIDREKSSPVDKIIFDYCLENDLIE